MQGIANKYATPLEFMFSDEFKASLGVDSPVFVDVGVGNGVEIDAVLANFQNPRIFGIEANEKLYRGLVSKYRKGISNGNVNIIRALISDAATSFVHFHVARSDILSGSVREIKTTISSKLNLAPVRLDSISIIPNSVDVLWINTNFSELDIIRSYGEKIHGVKYVVCASTLNAKITNYHTTNNLEDIEVALKASHHLVGVWRSCTNPNLCWGVFASVNAASIKPEVNRQPTQSIAVRDLCPIKQASELFTYFSESYDASPKLSILIPTATNLDVLRRCINSIYLNTEDFELIIVVNTDDVKYHHAVMSEFRHRQNIFIISIPFVSGYIATINAAAKLSTGKFLCILNDDVIVGQNWAETAISRLESDLTLGLVGPAVNYRNRKWECSGNPKDSKYVEGWCIFLRRQLYAETLDGKLFDSTLEFAYCEDSELSERVAGHGLSIAKVAMNIHHLGSQTSRKSDFFNKLTKKYENSNRRKLIARYS